MRKSKMFSMFTINYNVGVIIVINHSSNLIELQIGTKRAHFKSILFKCLHSIICRSIARYMYTQYTVAKAMLDAGSWVYHLLI